LSQAAISDRLEITLKTLRKHYRRDLDFGLDEANAAVASNMLRIATLKQPNPTAAVVAAGFRWLDRRAGWQKSGPSGLFGDGEIPSRIEVVWD